MICLGNMCMDTLQKATMMMMTTMMIIIIIIKLKFKYVLTQKPESQLQEQHELHTIYLTNT
jgi:hypothetical protein